MVTRVLIVGLLLYVAIRVAFWFYRQVKLYLSQVNSVSRRPDASDMVRDPVCGIYVAASQALREVTGSGTFYFCSRQCRDRFLEARR